MKKERLSRLLGLSLLCLLIVSGCKKDDGEDTVKDLPFVVCFDETENLYLLKSIILKADKTEMLLYSEDIANLTGIEEGMCGIGDFSIDFLNKVNSRYYNAMVLTWREAPLSEFTMIENPNNMRSDSLKLTWSKGSNFVGHTLFLKLSQKFMIGAEYDYRMNYDAIEQPVGNTFTLNLNALMTQPNTDTTSVSKTIGLTFDMEEFFAKYAGRDTFSFVVKYVSGLDAAGLYKYENFNLPTQVTVNPVAKP